MVLGSISSAGFAELDTSPEQSKSSTGSLPSTTTITVPYAGTASAPRICTSLTLVQVIHLTSVEYATWLAPVRRLSTHIGRMPSTTIQRQIRIGNCCAGTPHAASFSTHSKGLTTTSEVTMATLKKGLYFAEGATGTSGK